MLAPPRFICSVQLTARFKGGHAALFAAVRAHDVARLPRNVSQCLAQKSRIQGPVSQTLDCVPLERQRHFVVTPANRRQHRDGRLAELDPAAPQRPEVVALVARHAHAPPADQARGRAAVETRLRVFSDDESTLQVLRMRASYFSRTPSLCVARTDTNAPVAALSLTARVSASRNARRCAGSSLLYATGQRLCVATTSCCSGTT